MDRLALLVGVLAIAVAVEVYFLQRKKKSLSFRVVTNTSLLPLDEAVKSEAKDKLQILFDGKPVQNVHLLELEILNDGNVPIPTSDFERPLTFKLGTVTKILVEPELVRVSGRSLKPTWGSATNSIHIDPLLLNSKDSMIFKFLLDEFDGAIDADTRIVGVKEITRALSVEEQSLRSARTSIRIGLILFAVVVVMAVTSSLLGRTTLYSSVELTLAMFGIYWIVDTVAALLRLRARGLWAKSQ